MQPPSQQSRGRTHSAPRNPQQAWLRQSWFAPQSRHVSPPLPHWLTFCCDPATHVPAPVQQPLAHPAPHVCRLAQSLWQSSPPLPHCVAFCCAGWMHLPCLLVQQPSEHFLAQGFFFFFLPLASVPASPSRPIAAPSAPPSNDLLFSLRERRRSSNCRPSIVPNLSNAVPRRNVRCRSMESLVRTDRHNK